MLDLSVVCSRRGGASGVVGLKKINEVTPVRFGRIDQALRELLLDELRIRSHWNLFDEGLLQLGAHPSKQGMPTMIPGNDGREGFLNLGDVTDLASAEQCLNLKASDSRLCACTRGANALTGVRVASCSSWVISSHPWQVHLPTTVGTIGHVRTMISEDLC